MRMMRIRRKMVFRIIGMRMMKKIRMMRVMIRMNM